MTHLLFANGRLLDPEVSEPVAADLLVEAGRIRAVLTQPSDAPHDARVIDLGGAWLAPGFIDLHLHGSAIFSGPDGLNDALARDAASCVRHGCTAFLATTLAWPMTQLGEFVTHAASCAAELTSAGARVLGLHLEGPWINPGAAGAQPRRGIAELDLATARELLDRGEGGIRVVTYAPELPGATDLQQELSHRGIVGALGHSLAAAGEVCAAVDRGARHVTHLFNAMGPLHHRSPGLAIEALADDRLSCDLICDGVHVHPRAVEVASRAAGDRLTLITDRIEPPASGALAGESLRDDGAAWRMGDGRLAGSRVSLDAALRNFVVFARMSLPQAMAACTLRPARVLGIESQRGSLRPGARADLVVLDEALEVRETWLAGERVYAA